MGLATAPAEIWGSLERLRAAAPLVHNITNVVVTNWTANVLLAIGASPAMVEGTDEAEELAGVASALVVNVGTLSAPTAAAMRLATRRALEAGVPWVLDPVAVGVLSYRSRLAADLLQHRPGAIRGNASEVLSLAGSGGGRGKGVDSTADSADAIDSAHSLARRTGAVVAVTGAVDQVTDGETVVAIHNGSPMMTRVTGTGCAATALIGAFLAAQPDPLAAVCHALCVFGIAGELAAEKASGPGTFQIQLLDALHALDEPTIAARARIA